MRCRATHTHSTDRHLTLQPHECDRCTHMKASETRTLPLRKISSSLPILRKTAAVIGFMEWFPRQAVEVGCQKHTLKSFVSRLGEVSALYQLMCFASAFIAFNTPAKVLYDYQGQSDEELSVREGMSIFVGDKVDADWVRAVHDGRVGLVPLAYIEESQ